MDLKALEKRMHQFVESKGWYRADSKKKQSPKNLAVSLVLEASEVLEHFQWVEDVKRREELAGELADVALYLLQIASVTGIDLEEAILAKLEANRDREWPGP